jgi:ribosome-binding protein aMBF1 (putative translation factor)
LSAISGLLRLNEGEITVVEMRVRLARKVRELRIAAGLTQQELAARLQSTQPRVARMEQAVASLEMLIRALRVALKPPARSDTGSAAA